MKVLCYYRHSTDSLQQDKNSIERQRYECRKHAEKLGWDIIEEVQDKGQSGDGDKKNLELLKTSVADGEITFDCLLISDQSRLTRKSVFKMFEDIGFLDEAGIGIACVEDHDTVPRSIDDFGNDIGTIIKGWKNHDDVLKAASRSVSGLRSLHEQGRLSWIGQIPLGFDKLTKQLAKGTQTVLVANDELPLITEMFERFLGGASIRSLAPLLETASRFADGNKNASSQSVKTKLRNPIYCGIWAFGLRNVGEYRSMNPKGKKNLVGVNVLANAPSIIDYDVEKAVSKEQFLRAQEILDSNQSKTRGAPVTAGHRYSGLLKCSSCGGAVIAHKRTWKKKDATQKHLIDYSCFASSQSGKKCRGDEKPWRRSVSELDIDSELQIIFGTKMIWLSGFHISLINVLADELRVTNGGTTDIDKELADLEIEEMKYNSQFQQSDGALPEIIMQSWRELEKRVRELKVEKEKGSTAGISSFVENGIKSQAEKGTPQFSRYLNGILEIAKRLAVEPEYNAEDELLEMLKETLLNPADGSEVQLLVNADDQIQGYLFPIDNILALLRSMGLEHFRLQWELGTKRGKPQQLLKSIELVFSWSDLVTGLTSTRKPTSTRPTPSTQRWSSPSMMPPEES